MQFIMDILNLHIQIFIFLYRRKQTYIKFLYFYKQNYFSFQNQLRNFEFLIFESKLKILIFKFFNRAPNFEFLIFKSRRQLSFSNFWIQTKFICVSNFWNETDFIWYWNFSIQTENKLGLKFLNRVTPLFFYFVF